MSKEDLYIRDKPKRMRQRTLDNVPDGVDGILGERMQFLIDVYLTEMMYPAEYIGEIHLSQSYVICDPVLH